MPDDDRPVLQVGHSPDPDDVFMWWPLFGESGRSAAIDTGRFRYVSLQRDIESLNRDAAGGDLEITAISCAHYPAVRDRYALTSCGASMGDRYGPRLVARHATSVAELKDGRRPRLAIPGERTSAFAAASLLLGPGAFDYEVVEFDRIIEVVANGGFDAGLVIHEGQLTFEDAGLHLVADLGAWWASRFDLPLPLGVNAIRRDLVELHGPGTLEEVATTMSRALEHALEHRAESIERASVVARGMGADLTDEFVRMYVNRWSVELDETARRAITTFLEQSHRAGLVPDPGTVDIVEAMRPSQPAGR